MTVGGGEGSRSWRRKGKEGVGWGGAHRGRCRARRPRAGGCGPIAHRASCGTRSAGGSRPQGGPGRGGGGAPTDGRDRGGGLDQQGWWDGREGETSDEGDPTPLVEAPILEVVSRRVLVPGGAAAVGIWLFAGIRMEKNRSIVQGVKT